MSTIKKQKTILDFFKSNKIVNINTEQNLINNQDKFDQQNINSKVSNDPKESNKPPPTTTASNNTLIINNNDINKQEDSLIDVNCIDESLLNFCFEETPHDEEEIVSIKENPYFSYEKFRNIIKIILNDSFYEYLFNENDWVIIQDFTCLNGPIQLLYIKLYMRKHEWIKRSNIKYPEVIANGSLPYFLKILTEHNFLHDSSILQSVKEGLSALTMIEIKNFLQKYKGFTFPNNSWRIKVIELFLNYIRTTKSVNSDSPNIEKEVLRMLKKFCLGNMFKINEEKSKLFDRIFLLYYCPNYFLDKIKNQDQWHRYVLGDFQNNDKIYPVLDTNKSVNLYTSREDFINFTEGFQTLCDMIALLNSKQHFEIVENHLPDILQKYLNFFEEFSQKDMALNLFLREFTTTGIFVKIIHECLPALEKIQNYQEYLTIVQLLLSQQIYGTKFRPHWYSRCSLISYCRLKNKELTESICLAGLNDPFVKDSHRIELYSRLTKVKKISNSPSCLDIFTLDNNINTIYADYRHIENETGQKNFFHYENENGDIELISVEEVVQRHYRSLGYTEAIHCESSVYQTLFGLLFWKIIYSNEFADSFRYYQQIAPLDLNYDCFYQTRKDHIDKRVSQIEIFDEKELAEELKNAHLEFGDKITLFFNDNVSIEKIIEIASCLTAPKLAKILQLMAKDFRHFRKGFPDLICWNMKTKKIKVVEVKGPKDSLSNIQSIWLTYFKNFEIDAEVCFVKPKPL